jgi:hypothetical protein
MSNLKGTGKGMERNQSAKPSKMVAIRIPVELEAEARLAASEDSRTLTSLVVHLLRRHLQEHRAGRAA